MNKTGKVLEFCIELGRRMIVSGANLERVELAIQLICRVYGFTDISIFMLSSHISIGVMDGDGQYCSRQVNVPPAGIHLEKLKRLNRLSYTVVNDTPDPDELPSMLNEASAAREYGSLVVLAARIAAMICLCLMFGGGAREVVATALLTVLIEFVGRAMRKADLNRLVSSALIMFLGTIVIMILFTTGLSARASVLIITITMIFLPGIPLVNAVKNLICDHEMNGILQLMKVFIETAALGAGIYAAVYLFRGGAGLGDQALDTLSAPVLLIILSFVASMGFGMVFQIPPHDLWRAGIGGVLTRIVLLFLPGALPYRIVYTGIAALTASLYAEFLASKRKDPSTYFVYPAIIPLIPGDMFFHMIIGILYNDWNMALTNGSGCLVALLGMSIGFVLSSSIAHYMRKMKHKIHLNRFVPKVRHPHTYD